jgi:hypothetical protein
MDMDVQFIGPSRPLLPNDELMSEDSYEHPDDTKRWERKERRYSQRKLQQIRQEEKEHASKIRARMNRPDMAILFGGNPFGPPRPNLLMKNKYARLNDSPSPPRISLDEWEASTANRRLMPRLANPDNNRYNNIDPPPGLEHTTLIRRKPNSS